MNAMKCSMEPSPAARKYSFIARITTDGLEEDLKEALIQHLGIDAVADMESQMCSLQYVLEAAEKDDLLLWRYNNGNSCLTLSKRTERIENIDLDDENILREQLLGKRNLICYIGGRPVKRMDFLSMLRDGDKLTADIFRDFTVLTLPRREAKEEISKSLFQSMVWGFVEPEEQRTLFGVHEVSVDYEEQLKSWVKSRLVAKDVVDLTNVGGLGFSDFIYSTYMPTSDILNYTHTRKHRPIPGLSKRARKEPCALMQSVLNRSK